MPCGLAEDSERPHGQKQALLVQVAFPGLQRDCGAAGSTARGYIQVASFVGVLLGGLWADRWSSTLPRARALVPAIGF